MWVCFQSKLRSANERSLLLRQTIMMSVDDGPDERWKKWNGLLAVVWCCSPWLVLLAKTLQILALLLSRPSGTRHLVVAPTSVCTSWVREIERFAPALRATDILHAARKMSPTCPPLKRPELLFERRLSRSLFLLVQPRLLYHKAADEPLDPDFETTTFEESRLAIEAGIRWVANPGGAIELGMSHLAHVEYNRFVQQGRYGWLSFGAERAEAEQIAVGLSNAFIAERRLIPHLWLRLGVGLFGLQYYSTKILARDEEEDEETGETTEIEQDARTKGLRGGLSPTLALQVRLTF